MSGISEATSAFQSEIAPNSAPAKGDGGTVERLFDAPIDQSEEAGGDDYVPPKARVEAGDEDEGVEGDDEGTGEGSEGEDEGEEGEEGAEANDDEAEAGDVDLTAEVEVVVDGVPTKVALREALDGYIRTETFHKRLNEVQAVKQEVERQAGEVSQARNLYVDMLTNLAKELDSVAPKEPDWDKAFAEDPVSAGQLKYQWDKYKEQRASLDREQERIKQEAMGENARKFQQFAEQERTKMFEAFPEWRDPKVWERDRSAMRKVALDAGFTEEEIKMTVDSRYVKLLSKAAKYDRMVAKRPKPDAVQPSGGPRPLRPGTGASRTVPKGQQQAMSRLSKTGNMSDAVDVFSGMLQSEGKRRK